MCKTKTKKKNETTNILPAPVSHVCGGVKREHVEICHVHPAFHTTQTRWRMATNRVLEEIYKLRSGKHWGSKPDHFESSTLQHSGSKSWWFWTTAAQWAGMGTKSGGQRQASAIMLICLWTMSGGGKTPCRGKKSPNFIFLVKNKKINLWPKAGGWLFEVCFSAN